MANMSYCRVQNTAKDLKDVDREGLYDLDSVSEAEAAIKLYKLCQNIVECHSLESLEEELEDRKKEEQD